MVTPTELPSIALSGISIPVNSLPVWVQYPAKFVLMRHGNRIFEGIMLKGYGLGELLLGFVVIGEVVLLFLLLTAGPVGDRIMLRKDSARPPTHPRSCRFRGLPPA
jgi:ABC-type multidrug transport system permease subunit